MVPAASPTLSSPNPLALPVARLFGVGDKTLEVLHKNNIVTIFDLLLRMPKSLVTQDKAPGFLHMEAGRTYVACGKVVATKLTGFAQKRRLEAILEDETGRLRTIFFGPAVNFAQQVLQKDQEVTVIGQVKDFLGRPQMVHPKLLTTRPNTVIDDTVATYSQLGGLTSAVVKRIVDRALGEIAKARDDDHVTPELLTAYNLAPLKAAFKRAHNPTNDNDAWDQRAKSPVFRRLALEEVLSFYTRLNRERGDDRHKASCAIVSEHVDKLCENFLPFALTCAQQRVCAEIIDDLARPIAMSRLVQGDVGSGKTAVSAIAARHVARAGFQIAVMAPTEILAEQLFKVYQSFFANENLGIALLTAHQKGKERLELTQKIAQQEITIVVGTHALLSDDVVFKRLGLVVIDEQHRFGVKQRAELLNECQRRQGFCPHLLVMSATPIPRSLALTFYGDLDLSVIDERPKGRQPIHTQIITGTVLENIGRCCKRIIETNQKAFVVFPLVEESEHLDLENATKAVRMLKGLFGEASSLLLHGKMKPAEKVEAMKAFRENQISLLVATTVVEVGIDIPDATCMVIAHPERFGLAQLHQLRGRVGRKDLKSYCLLVSDITNKFAPAYKRLSAMCNTDDGFKLAEIDLEIRGPGELLGTKQSGLPNFLVFNYTDFADLVQPAKTLAKAIHERGAQPTHAHLFGSDAAHFS